MSLYEEPAFLDCTGGTFRYACGTALAAFHHCKLPPAVLLKFTVGHIGTQAVKAAKAGHIANIVPSILPQTAANCHSFKGSVCRINQ